MSRIEVAVAAPLSQTLSYSFDQEVDGDPVGRRVLVRMGAQQITGYALGILPEEEVSYKILPIIRFLDEFPLFPNNLVPFFSIHASFNEELPQTPHRNDDALFIIRQVAQI